MTDNVMYDDLLHFMFDDCGAVMFDDSGGVVGCAPTLPDTFAVARSRMLFSGSGDTDWLGRPQLLVHNGVWLLVYRQAHRHLPDANSCWHIHFSDDEGETWTAADTTLGGDPVVNAPFLPHDGYDLCDGYLIHDPTNGDLLMLASEDWPGATVLERNGTYQWRSTDDGASWTDEGMINDDPGLLLAGGQMVTIGSVNYAAAFVDPSDDGQGAQESQLYTYDGETWDYVSTIVTGTNEVGLVHLGGTTLLAMMRDDNGAATYQRKSPNLGLTWGTLANITGTLGVMQRPMLWTFADEPGRIYLTAREYLSSSAWYTIFTYSDDDGQTWSDLLRLQSTPLGDGSYTSLLKRTNGQFYLISYEGPNTASASIYDYLIERV